MEYDSACSKKLCQQNCNFFYWKIAFLSLKIICYSEGIESFDWPCRLSITMENVFFSHLAGSRLFSLKNNIKSSLCNIFFLSFHLFPSVWPCVAKVGRTVHSPHMRMCLCALGDISHIVCHILTSETHKSPWLISLKLTSLVKINLQISEYRHRKAVQHLNWMMNELAKDFVWFDSCAC